MGYGVNNAPNPPSFELFLSIRSLNPVVSGWVNLFVLCFYLLLGVLTKVFKQDCRHSFNTRITRELIDLTT